MTNKWNATQIPDLTGKVAIVTGGNSGIGLEAARELARKGAWVWIAARNEGNNQRTQREILREIPNAKVEVRRLDLGDLASIDAFVEQFNDSGQPLDLLINNAGIMAVPYAKTTSGFERHLGVNHLGHFALTGLLLRSLLAAPAARVVTISSRLHRLGTLDFGNLNWENGKFEKWRAYGRSKLANLLFTFTLQRRFERAGARAISVAAHPGYTSTNLQLLPSGAGTSTFERFLVKFSRFAGQPAAMGVLPTLYAATAPELQGGEFVGPGGLLGLYGYPRLERALELAYDVELGEQLWRASQALTHVHYDALEPIPV